MKKFIIVVVIMATMITPSFINKIDATSVYLTVWATPSASTVTNAEIRWTTNNVSQIVSKATIHYGLSSSSLTQSVSVNSSIINYTNLVDLAPDTTYYYKVNAIVNGSSVESPTQSFKTLGTGTLEVISPNGGESWGVGEAHTITWNQKGVSSVSFKLIDKHGTVRSIESDVPTDSLKETGSYVWNIPENLLDMTINRDYKIEISAWEGVYLRKDTSDDYFKLTTPKDDIPLTPPDMPDISITIPGSSLVFGNTYNASWNSECKGGTVNLFISPEESTDDGMYYLQPLNFIDYNPYNKIIDYGTTFDTGNMSIEVPQTLGLYKKYTYSPYSIDEYYIIFATDKSYSIITLEQGGSGSLFELWPGRYRFFIFVSGLENGQKCYTKGFSDAFTVSETSSTQPTPSTPQPTTPAPTKPSAPASSSSSWVDQEESLYSYTDWGLVNRFKGQILLQAEEHGEAWYLDPESTKKYYLKDGPVAYEALRKFGLGITNANLEKIPVGLEDRFEDLDSDGDSLPDKLEEGLKTDTYKADTDGDGHNDGEEILSGNNPLGPGKMPYSSSLVNDLKGKILLQVESRGEAWYINPKDGKRYYMKNGDAAYQIMRFLSSGMFNVDLRKIPVGRIESL